MLEYRNKKDALYTLEMNVLEVETAISKTKKKKRVLHMLWENSVPVVHCEGEEERRGEGQLSLEEG